MLMPVAICGANVFVAGSTSLMNNTYNADPKHLPASLSCANAGNRQVVIAVAG